MCHYYKKNVTLQKLTTMGDIELLENEEVLRGIRFPHKIERVTQIVITAGSISCIVDFRHYSLTAPAMAIFLPDQVVESIEVDEEFQGLGMVISEEFTNSMNLPVSLQERLFLKNNQFHAISNEELKAYLSCFDQVSSVMKQEENPYREEIIKHLFSAYYYGLGYYIHSQQAEHVAMTPQQELCERFIAMVAENFKRERDIGFYADRLCVTNKYLSTLLKQHTGMTALEWIERHVVLYAKSCLSSTTMSVQQISDDLDFPSQSVFGKYFKRVEGLSPKAYRQSLK